MRRVLAVLVLVALALLWIAATVVAYVFAFDATEGVADAGLLGAIFGTIGCLAIFGGLIVWALVQLGVDL